MSMDRGAKVRRVAGGLLAFGLCVALGLVASCGGCGVLVFFPEIQGLLLSHRQWKTCQPPFEACVNACATPEKATAYESWTPGPAQLVRYEDFLRYEGEARGFDLSCERLCSADFDTCIIDDWERSIDKPWPGLAPSLEMGKVF